MKMDTKVQYILTLTPAEFNLLTKALRGTLKDADKPAAQELQEELLKSKVNNAKGYAAEMAKLEANLESC